jgi:DNA-binding MarR family transcriptional regulator
VNDDVDELGADLRRAITRVYSRFRSERLEGEVPDAALLVLRALDKRESMSLTDLAESARVTLGSMSQTVRRLEEDAYVSKTRAADDRRKVIFALTSYGKTTVSAMRQHRRDWLNGQLARLTGIERDELSQAAALLLRIANS